MRPRHAFRAIFGLALVLSVPAYLLLGRAGRPALGAREPGPAGLRLAWVRHQAPLTPTWPDQPRFTSDGACRPVVAGDLVLLTSSRHDSLTAVDRRSGESRWRFRADGPIRFAPAVWRDRALVASDDGHLYCVRLGDGTLAWRFRGGPAGRPVLGNERLISTWPARGGPAVAAEPDGSGTVYFAAGIWPFMGIFLHALDARTGDPRWSNSGEGASFIKQPHNTDAFAGIAPQGSLVVAGDRLIVPGGRSIPACFDRHTGRRLHFRLAESSKRGGGPDLAVGPGVYHSGGGVFEVASGKYLGPVSEPVAFAGSTLFSAAAGRIRAFDLDAPPPRPRPGDRTSRGRTAAAGEAWLGDPRATAAVGRTSLLAATGERLYGATAGSVFALALPLTTGRQRPAWKAPLDGTPVHLVVEGDTVLVSTREGRVYAFAPGDRPLCDHPTPLTPLPAAGAAVRSRTDRLLRAARVDDGYAVVWGVGDGSLVLDLTCRSTLRLLVFDPDPAAVARLRDRLEGAGVGGERVSVRVGSPEATPLPPYVANLIICQAPGLDAPGAFDRLFGPLRPFGGVAVFPGTPETLRGLRRWRDGRSADAQAAVEAVDGFALLRRPGEVPGTADWTHQHADAANTRVSRDRVIKAPLGLLWFGGPGHQGVLPRHGHGPVPQVSRGRLLIEGPDRLRAIDVYTGRLLWEALLPGLGKAYDNLAHQPGANARGSNYVSTPDGIYVAYRDGCLRLDPATGRTLDHFRLPTAGTAAPPWTFLTVAGDYLIAGSGQPAAPPQAPKKAAVTPGASKRLTVLDRTTGRVRFAVEAGGGFRHNGICVGNGILFAIDRAPGAGPARGKEAGSRGRVVAYDLASGERLWHHARETFGTWLSYSTDHDVLVEAGLMARDTLADEAPGMRAFRGQTGKVLWHRPDYFGPALLHGDRVLKGGDARAGSGTACDLRSGEPIETIDPLTGTAVPWRWERTYGCNTPAASEHLILFRSGAAGYYDLCNDGGTGNLGGFRSSCTLNLIAAGGVLTAPDYTRTCSCSYQNQTSIGFIHDPDAEEWTFSTKRPVRGVVRRVGVNLAAPGSRKAADGTLWLEHPPAGGPSPRLGVRTTPTTPAAFRMHPSQVEGAPPAPWVGASGMRGLRRLVVPLGEDGGGPRRYTVRMVFLEPDALPAGKRLFNVRLQGKAVLNRLDVAAEAGGARRVVVREFTGIAVGRELTIDLAPCPGAAVAEPVLAGVEVRADGW